MFKIRILTDEWHEIQNDNLKVINPTLKEKLNGCGSLTYSIPIGDLYYNDYERLKTKVEVSEDGALQFVGRLLETKKDFNNTLTLIFEGEMAYLNDVQYPPYEFSGTIAELFTNVLNYYNSKCSPNNQITKGNITVVDKNNYIARKDENYSSCWGVLTKKLVELCGGYLVMRWVVTDNQTYRYLDYLEEAGTLSTQRIEYGENLINLTQELNGDDIITRIIPFGAKDETTGEKVTIESVNPTGEKFITSNKSSIYGIIEQIVEWEDVTLPQNLYNKALAYLSEHDTSGTMIKVTALDLHAIDVDIARLDVGDKVDVVSTPHNINTTMLVNERTRNLNDVSKDTITLGTEEKTFTSSVDSATMNPEVEIDEETIKSLARQQTDILLGGTGGFFEMLYEDASNPTKPTGFRIMDSMSEGTAQNVLLVNNNGIGFSNTGVEGLYYNAWTIDGRLSANAIATGVLQDSQGNFVLDLDTGILTVGKLTLNTPDLIFGDINNQYIEVTTTDDNNGILFNGTGNIKMTPTGRYEVQNTDNTNYWNSIFFTHQVEPFYNQSHVYNYDNENHMVNSLNFSASSTSFETNFYNKDFEDYQNWANFIILRSAEQRNTMTISNYRPANNIYANGLSLSSESDRNTLYITNREYENSNDANVIGMGSTGTINSCHIMNRLNGNLANVFRASTGYYVDYNTAQLMNYARNGGKGNEIELLSTTQDGSGSRTVRIYNYNNTNDTISNAIYMYKQETTNYIQIKCISADITMAEIKLNTFDDLFIVSRDRVNHEHGIHIQCIDANGYYKAGLKYNGYTLYIEGGYVKARF